MSLMQVIICKVCELWITTIYIYSWMKNTWAVCLVGRWVWPGLGLSAETESMRALPLHSLGISYQDTCLPNMFRYIWRSVTRRFWYIEIVELMNRFKCFDSWDPRALQTWWRNLETIAWKVQELMVKYFVK